MTFHCMNIWRLPYHINSNTTYSSSLPVLMSNSAPLIDPNVKFWNQFGNLVQKFYNLTSDDLWPWYMTFDLIYKWRFPCCTYVPTLVEVHQSMWKIEPNVNPFFHDRQQTTTTDNKWGQSDPYVSLIPAKAGDTKTDRESQDTIVVFARRLIVLSCLAPNLQYKYIVYI